MKKNITLFALACLSNAAGLFGSAEKSIAECNPLIPNLASFSSSNKASVEVVAPNSTPEQQATKARRETDKRVEDVKKKYKNLLQELDANPRNDQNIRDIQTSLAHPYYQQALERLNHEPKWKGLVKRAKTKFQRYYHEPLITNQAEKAAAE